MSIPIAGSAAPRNEVTFRDAAGDATGGAAEILSVSILDNGLGKLTFALELANRSRGLGADDYVHIFLDTDQDPLTGDWRVEGSDYAIQADAKDKRVGLFHWDGEQWASVGDATLGASSAQRIWINARELGSTASFQANFDTNRHSNGNAYDIAGPINFAVSSGPPGPRRLSVVSLTTRPSLPKAGKRLVVRLVAQRDDTGDVVPGGTVRCSAKIGTKAVKTAFRGYFIEILGSAMFGEQSHASCGWNVPRGSRGRRINGVITVASDGLRLRQAFAFQIR